METEIKNPEPEKDEMLVKLENMLKNLPEGSRQPIINLISKRKVELGLKKSELPPAGYKLKKARAKSKQVPAEKKESLQKIARNIGIVKETDENKPTDIDIKNEPLRKDKKILEEADSFKY